MWPRVYCTMGADYQEVSPSYKEKGEKTVHHKLVVYVRIFLVSLGCEGAVKLRHHPSGLFQPTASAVATAAVAAMVYQHIRPPGQCSLRRGAALLSLGNEQVVRAPIGSADELRVRPDEAGMEEAVARRARRGNVKSRKRGSPCCREGLFGGHATSWPFDFVTVRATKTSESSFFDFAIGHYSGGNIATEKIDITIPITKSLCFAFWFRVSSIRIAEYLTVAEYGLTLYSFSFL